MFGLNFRVQDLNDNNKHLFYKRGWVTKYEPVYKTYLRWELVTQPACSFRFSVDTGDDGRSFGFSIGFIFFTLYLTILRPKWLDKVIAPLSGREFGFYWMDKECRINFGTKPWGSNNDGWYTYFRPLQILFGKQLNLSGGTGYENYSPIYFKFRGEEYNLKTKGCYIETRYVFRSRIPFGLYHHKWLRASIEIEKPIMHAGKGTTSYNCGDDGTWAISCEYDGPKLSNWNDREKFYQWCVDKYMESAIGSIKRYGNASKGKGSKDFDFEYIGFKRDLDSGKGLLI
jgi:hypothetical protein